MKKRQLTPEQVRARAKRRMAKLHPPKPADIKRSKLDPELKRDLIRKAKQCAYCHAKERLTIDHIQPLSRGGSNAKKNLQVLCEDCNVKKGSDLYDEKTVLAGSSKPRK